MTSQTNRALPIWVAFLGIILGVISWAVVGHFQNAPYAIEVDGKQIVTVESRSAAKRVLADVRLQGTSDASPRAVRFVESVTFHRAQGRAALSDLPEAVRAIEEVVSMEAERWAIIVNDKPAIALTRKKDAEKALELVKRFYESKVKSLYSRSTFKESVFVDRRFVEIEKLRSSPEDAFTALTTTSEAPLVHTVKRGDRAVHIVTQYDISMSQLKSLNPRVDPDTLIEGDLLTIRLPKLPITVICKSMVTESVSVSPPKGVRYDPRTGTRVSKMLVTYENGQKVSEEVISQVTTWERQTTRSYRSSRHRSQPVRTVTGAKPAEQGSGKNADQSSD